MIKDVVEEEEEMWSTLTGKIKHNAGGAEDIRRVRENRFPLCRCTIVHLLPQFRSQPAPLVQKGCDDVIRAHRVSIFKNYTFKIRF